MSYEMSPTTKGTTKFFLIGNFTNKNMATKIVT